MAEKKTIQLEVKTNSQEVIKDLNNTSEAVENLGNKTQEAGQKTGVFNDIRNVMSKMVPAFKNAQTGAIGFGSSLKALALNPVVLMLTAIVGTAKLIYEGFENTAEGSKKLAASMIALKSTTTNVKDGLLGMAQALGYDLLSVFQAVTGQFDAAKESFNAANEISDKAWKQMTKTIDKNTVNQLYQIERRQQANEKFKKKLEISESEINKLLVKSREILTDENNTIAEKSKALDEVTKYETSYSNKKVYAAKVDLELAKERVKYTEKGSVTEKEAKAKVREATIALNNAETENNQNRIKLNRQRKMLHRQEIADSKEAVAAAKAKAKEEEEAAKESIKLENERLANLEKKEGDTRKAVQDAENAYFESKLTKQQQEERAVQEKYFNLIEQAKQYNIDTKVLEEAQQKELNDIKNKYKQKEIDAIKEANKLKVEQENAFQLQVEDIDEANFQSRLQNSMSNKDYELELVRQKYFALEQAAKGNAEQEKIIAEAKEREIAGIENNYRRKKWEMASAALAALGDLTTLYNAKNEKDARRQFKIQKAFNLSTAIINTGLAVTAALTGGGNVAKIASSMNFVEAGIAAATGAVNIAKIAATQYDTSRQFGDDKSSKPPSPTSLASMTPSFNITGGNQTSQLLQGLQAQPIKAYVVSSDITSAQLLDQKAIKTSVL
jgi:hypothetical protein